jgi:hypothetical protein
VGEVRGEDERSEYGLRGDEPRRSIGAGVASIGEGVGVALRMSPSGSRPQIESRKKTVRDPYIDGSGNDTVTTQTQRVIT